MPTLSVLARSTVVGLILVAAADPAAGSTGWVDASLPAGHHFDARDRLDVARLGPLGIARQGSLSISVPPSRALGSTFVGATLSGQLGNVTVSDNRAGVNPNTWTVTVSSTAYTTGAGLPAQTIANSRMSYWSGPQIHGTGGGTRIPGQPTSAQAQSLGTARVAFRKISGAGNNTCQWRPTVIMSVPGTAVAGLYTGRITHSVA
nr:hypothetical protein [Micromonospora sp. DSM 115978]